MSVFDPGVHACMEAVNVHVYSDSCEDNFSWIFPRHGNNCAGVIAGVANNSLCGVGIAYNAQIAGTCSLMWLPSSLTVSPKGSKSFNVHWDSLEGYECLLEESFILSGKISYVWESQRTQSLLLVVPNKDTYSVHALFWMVRYNCSRNCPFEPLF